MPRPPLPLGSWGEIYVVARSGGWQARARYRDFDGRTRPVSAHGKTRAHAKRRLRDALGARATPSGAAISRDSRLTALAEVYLAEAEGEGSGVSRQSLDQYLDDRERYIKPAMGDLRLREVTPVSCAAFLATLADRPATHAKVRSRLQGILQAGVRLDLFETNPASATKPPKRTFTATESTTPTGNAAGSTSSATSSKPMWPWRSPTSTTSRSVTSAAANASPPTSTSPAERKHYSCSMS